ncbi:MAG: LacI family DNA-binding transcriptional regulator [Kineosporiaceae bacterium]
MKRPTIADIAVRARVSKGAVSYALNGQPGVSEATRARIVAIAEEMGWSPNSAARALSAARTDTLGFCLSRPTSTLGLEPFFMEFISGIESELSQSGKGLLLQMVSDHMAELDVYRRWWSGRRVDGVIVADLQVDDRRVPLLRELELPAVVAGGPLPEPDALTHVWTDDAATMTRVLEYLAGLGHRRIARVGGTPEFVHTARRSEAFAEATTRLGLTWWRTLTTDFSDAVGASATRELLTAATRPTAIIYDNDVMAVAGQGVARDLGLDVPGDVSLVAWDDSALCRLTHPALTAMSRDVAAYGAHVARLLLAEVDGHAAPGQSVKQDDAVLVERATTAPPRVR